MQTAAINAAPMDTARFGADEAAAVLLRADGFEPLLSVPPAGAASGNDIQILGAALVAFGVLCNIAAGHLAGIQIDGLLPVLF